MRPNHRFQPLTQAAPDEYLAIAARLNQLGQRQAVLRAKEEEKRKEREALITELQAMGIDVTRPVEELERLEKEHSDRLTIANQQLDEYESQLAKLETEPNTGPTGR